jgi:hypothetical protein
MTPLLDFWPDDAAVTACIPSEAESLSDAAFLAVHQPMRLARRSLTDPNAPPVPQTERDLLAALLTERLPEGYVIVPVVGPSGVGKSHLIRWLGLHIERGRRHVIRIAKSTSLRQILEDILAGLEGPVYDTLRKELLSAREELDEIAAREELLAKFRIALQRKKEQADAECQAAVKRGAAPDPALRAIAESHADGLNALLDWPPTRDALLADAPDRPSVFRALIRRVTSGLIEAEHGQFEPHHFTFPKVTPGQVSDKKAQRYLGKLKANELGYREAAARLMNDVRDGAVAQLLGLGENQLADLFRRVRKQLLADGRELVLLIEDFTTLAGVQQGLLDVIKMEGVRGGEHVLCTLRTALAVTEGFLSPFDTIKTRAGYEWLLREVPTDDAAEVVATLTDMVGAYLNAARLGAASLKEWLAAADRNPDAPPPTFEPRAADLPDADREALDALGRSRRGHSLSPFNRATVRWLAEQHLSSGGHITLNPRNLIKYVLHRTLLDYRDDFARGAFPPAGFHGFDPNTLGQDVVNWLVQERRADFGRYAALLGYWGDRPRLPENLRLAEGVYRAFGLVPLGTGAAPEPPLPSEPAKPSVEPTVPPPPQGTPSPQPEDKTEKDIRKRLEVIEAWVSTRKLTQLDANRLRRDLLEMIDAGIDWDMELLAPSRKARAKAHAAGGQEEDGSAESAEDAIDQTWLRWIYLPYAKGGDNNCTPERALFTLCRDELFDDPVQFATVRNGLRALVRFHAHKTFDYAGGDEDRAWYAALAERARRQAVPFLRERYERVPGDPVPAVAQALYLSARILNLEGVHLDQDAAVVRALFAGDTEAPATGTAAGDPWPALRKKAADHRKAARDFLLRRTAARQGTGEVLYAVDAARLLAAVQPARKACELEAAFPATPSELEDDARRVLSFVEALRPGPVSAALEARRKRLVEWDRQTRAWLGDIADRRALVQSVTELTNAAKNLGVFPETLSHDTLRRHAEAFRDAAISDALEKAARLGEGAKASTVLTALVQMPDDAVRAADTFRASLDEFIRLAQEAAVKNVRQILREAGIEPTAEADRDEILRRAVRQLDEDFGKLAAALAGLGERPTAVRLAAEGKS